MPDEVDYFIGFETVTHIGNEKLRRVRVSYYQWAPLILLVQGLCFYIPFLIWNSCANNAGVKLRRLLKKASDIASLPPGCQQREALLAEFVDQFHTLVTGEAGWCADLQCNPTNSPANSASSSQASGSSGANSQQNNAGAPNQNSRGARNNNNNNEDPNGDGRGNHRGQQQAGCCLVSIPLIGSLLACCLKPCSSFGLVGPSKYLCLLYLAVKSAYVFNVGLQFFLLGQFLGRGYLRHGLELINRLIVNGDWWASPRFPLSTLCQVRADMSGGLRSYTCQCVLPINVFNEKIFSVVWFYMAFLMPLNVLSLLFWIYRTFETNRLSYIRLCLWRTRLVELNQIHRTVRRLSQSYLGWDGVFLLRLIEHNHGSIMATLIMSRLWEFYANQMKLQEDANQLALANNAHQTLSNTTTAISSQHQLLAAAAAAAAANQIGPGPGGGGGAGGHMHGPAHHGPGGGPHNPHGHNQPLMPAGGHNQAHFGHSGHSHGPGGQHFAGPHGPQMAPMAPHGPHAHHSGQISQAGHHPLHAANTHHSHAHANHHPVAGAHLGSAGPFSGTMSASILAQLQQQQQQQHSHQHSGAAGSNLAGQPHGPSAGTQQSASGNVAAAVAALAAAAAANSTSQQAAAAAAAAAAGQNNPNAPSAINPQPASSSNSATNHHHQMHLHSLMQQQQQQQQQASSANQQQVIGAQSGGSQVNAQLAVQAIQASNPTSGQQQQQASGSSGGASSATTSFITAASAAAASSGPPLPPPPPAHVVAAVAAASSAPATSSGAQSGATPSGGGPAPTAATVAPGMARTGGPPQPPLASGVAAGAAARGGAASGAQPPHANPLLFNLKSSSIVQAAANGTRYSPHAIKR